MNLYKWTLVSCTVYWKVYERDNHKEVPNYRPKLFNFYLENVLYLIVCGMYVIYYTYHLLGNFGVGKKLPTPCCQWIEHGLFLHIRSHKIMLLYRLIWYKNYVRSTVGYIGMVLFLLKHEIIVFVLFWICNIAILTWSNNQSMFLLFTIH